MQQQSRPGRSLTIRTPVRPEIRYEAFIGWDAWPPLQTWLPSERHGLAIISDETVWHYWGQALERCLEPLGEPVSRYLFPAGEQHKNRATRALLEDQLLADRWGRDVVILALGGGVTTDLAGFVAATYLRGVSYLNLPTTLLGMVDAALGGKTAIDAPAGKNLLGAFHPPCGVVAALECLTTLPAVELQNGLAETVKHAMIADKSLLDWLAVQADAIRALSPEVLLQLVERSAAIKIDLVGQDELDHGIRQGLNFGHTIGHALEQALDLALPHGHAVAIGMCVEADAALHDGLTSPATRQALKDVLERLALPTRLPPGFPVDRVLHALQVDKKNRLGEVRFALPSRPGELGTFDGAWTTPLSQEGLSQALKDRT